MSSMRTEDHTEKIHRILSFDVLVMFREVFL